MAFGIPPLLNKANDAIAVGQLLKNDLSLVSRALLKQRVQWGIFLNNKPVITPDSVLSFDFKQEYRIADYPMEQGAFQSYNKVATPYDARVSMSRGGTVADRQKFLLDAERITRSRDLYDVVTPEITYHSANIARFDYRRTTTNGVTLLTVDFWLLEIRETVQSVFFNTKQPSSQAVQNNGTVQAGASAATPVPAP